MIKVEHRQAGSSKVLSRLSSAAVSLSCSTPISARHLQYAHCREVLGHVPSLPCRSMQSAISSISLMGSDAGLSGRALLIALAFGLAVWWGIYRLALAVIELL